MLLTYISICIIYISFASLHCIKVYFTECIGCNSPKYASSFENIQNNVENVLILAKLFKNENHNMVNTRSFLC